MEAVKLHLEYGKIPEVFLLGNGINRAFNFASWTDLLNQLKVRGLTAEEESFSKEGIYPPYPAILMENHICSELTLQLRDLRRSCQSGHNK